MLENFHLTTIVKEGRDGMSLLQIPLDQDLQNTLAKMRQEQYYEFIHDEVREIDFHPGYQPEENEIFRLSDYKSPGWLAEQNSQTIPDLDPISDNDTGRGGMDPCLTL